MFGDVRLISCPTCLERSRFFINNREGNKSLMSVKRKVVDTGFVVVKKTQDISYVTKIALTAD